MWPGEQQPPGGEHHPQQPNPYQQPTAPHQHQANPHLQPAPHQQQAPWSTPAAGPGGPTPKTGGGGRGRGRAAVVAVAAATAVVVAAGLTGFLLLGGGEGGAQAAPSESASPRASASNPRAGDGTEATIAGWKVVVNPDIGVAFDVPAEWALKEPGWVSYVTEDDDAEENALIGMRAWSFVGPTGVSEEVPNATVRKILGTVRLYENPTTS